jgi:predicted RNA-binding Zn ribbon-like protein
MLIKIPTNEKGWKFVGGRLCLDFINTVGGRSSDHVLRDKLLNYVDLVEWSRLAGIVNRSEARRLARQAASDTRRAKSTLARVVNLREALYRIFKSVLEGQRCRPTDLETLNGELLSARAHERLIQFTGTFALTWQNGETALDSLIWPVSLSAIELLTSGDLSRVRECEGQQCGWMFLDISRNRSRHWCDMKDCGNRAKVRRFRERKTAAARVGA